jgi:hypothetical protein
MEKSTPPSETVSEGYAVKAQKKQSSEKNRFIRNRDLSFSNFPAKRLFLEKSIFVLIKFTQTRKKRLPYNSHTTYIIFQGLIQGQHLRKFRNPFYFLPQSSNNRLPHSLLTTYYLHYISGSFQGQHLRSFRNSFYFLPQGSNKRLPDHSLTTYIIFQGLLSGCTSCHFEIVLNSYHRA